MTFKKLSVGMIAASAAILLAACGADDLTTFNSANEVVNAVEGTGTVVCDHREPDVWGNGPASELADGEESAETCYLGQGNMNRAVVANDMTGHEYFNREWSGEAGAGGVAGENWAFECQWFDDITEDECSSIADDLGGELVIFRE